MAYGLFFGTKDGEIHALRLPSFYDETTPLKTWGDGSAVTGTFKSRDFDFGDWDTLKLIRKVFLSTAGTTTDVTLHYVKADGTTSSVQIMNDETLPESDSATPDIATVPRRIRGAAIEVSGVNVNLTSIDMLWRQIRMK